MTKTHCTIIAFVLGLAVGGGIVASATQARSISTDDPGVSGIGGVFFKAEDPLQLREWYQRHLGIDGQQPGVNFFWRDADDPERFGYTVWSVFPRETDYFGTGDQQFMINYRVKDLDGLLERLDTQGIPQIGETEDYWYGRFAWIEDAEGNRVELWEPVDIPRDEFNRRLEEESN